MEKGDYVEELAIKVGGTPSGMVVGEKGYTVHTEIYDILLLPNSASIVMEREM